MTCWPFSVPSATLQIISDRISEGVGTDTWDFTLLCRVSQPVTMLHVTKSRSERGKEPMILFETPRREGSLPILRHWHLRWSAYWHTDYRLISLQSEVPVLLHILDLTMQTMFMSCVVYHQMLGTTLTRKAHVLHLLCCCLTNFIQQTLSEAPCVKIFLKESEGLFVHSEEPEVSWYKTKMLVMKRNLYTNYLQFIESL
jgi:hypothetical protein